MALIVSLEGPRDVRLVEEVDASLESGQVRVRTLYSGISAGTELASWRGSNPHQARSWDPTLRRFREGAASTPYPVRNWGYEEVGEVSEVAGDVHMQPGTLVYGAWGHRSSAVLSAGYAQARVLPTGLPPLAGIFSHIGSVALTGIHDAAPRVGEWVAVFGLGVVGQILCQLAGVAGCRVIAVDRRRERLELAATLGRAQELIDAGEGGVAEQMRALTGGRGADVTIEASGAVSALHETVRSAAYGSQVVALGFYQGGAGELRLGEEFHHNRVRLISSQISGVAPELQGRWDRIRLARTVMELQAQGRLRLVDLVSRLVPPDRAAQAYQELDESPDAALQLVFDFTAAESGTDGVPEEGSGA